MQNPDVSQRALIEEAKLTLKLLEGQGKIVLKGGARLEIDMSGSLSEILKLIRPLKDGSIANVIKKEEVFALKKHTHLISDVNELQDALDNKQPLDTDLLTISNLTHSNRHVLISDGSAWTRRALVEADLPNISAAKITSGALDNARLSFNPDYFVQGTNAKRSYIFNSTNPLDNAIFSTFMELGLSDPNSPSANTQWGFRASSLSGAYTTEIVGRAQANELYLGGVHNGVRQPWRAIWHGGNLNPDYFVQGTNNRRMVLANSTNPLASKEYSTFFRMDNTEPSFDSRLTCGVGLGLKVINSSGLYSFELMGSPYDNGVLLLGGTDNVGQRYPWRAIWHEGNFDPDDYQPAISGTENTIPKYASGGGLTASNVADSGTTVKISKDTTIIGNCYADTFGKDWIDITEDITILNMTIAEIQVYIKLEGKRATLLYGIAGIMTSPVDVFRIEGIPTSVDFRIPGNDLVPNFTAITKNGHVARILADGSTSLDILGIGDVGQSINIFEEGSITYYID